MNQKSKRFPDSLKKLHRLLSILRMFDNRKQCTSETLAAKFNTTKRNIFRDINDLNSAGFAIAFDKEQNTYTSLQTRTSPFATLTSLIMS
ncbi:MAG: HTH domain-containing protein [Bacteroidetes bacterium]|nr:HTH domain-containing protein [Bacteroidota bacterium]